MSVFTVKILIAAGGFCRRFLVLDVYPKPVFEPASLPFLNGAGTAQKSAPLFDETTRWNGSGAKARHSAASDSAAEELPFHLQRGFEERLAQARELLAEWSSELAELDTLLSPVWLEERNLKDRIAATHKRDGDGRLVLNPDGKDDRAPLFGKLLRIAEQWGKTKEQRREVDRQCRSLAREINMLTKAIEKGRKRRGENKAA